MNRQDTDITTECSSVPADDTDARERLERFSRFLAIGAVRAAEGRSADKDASKEGADSKSDQSATDASNTSEMSGG